MISLKPDILNQLTESNEKPLVVRIDQVLGRGTFSTVYRAQITQNDNSNVTEYVALKVLRLKNEKSNGQDSKNIISKVKYGGIIDAEHRDCINEIVNLKKLDHPNIVRLLWWDYVPAGNEGEALLKIATELATGGDLRRMVHEHYAAGVLVKEATVWSCTVQLCAALQHMHEAGIMHRDIKPANIFVYNVYDVYEDADNDSDLGCDDDKLHRRWAQATLKLGDFGFSKGFRPHNGDSFGLRSVLGSPLYMSPERLRQVDGCAQGNDQEDSGTYYADSDMWSAACCVYELAALQAPFHLNGSLDMNLMMNRIVNGFYPPIPCDSYSPQMAQFIDACMVVNRRLRLSGSLALRRARAGLAETLRRQQYRCRISRPSMTKSKFEQSPRTPSSMVSKGRKSSLLLPETPRMEKLPRTKVNRLPLSQQQRPLDRLTVPNVTHLKVPL
ncbi:serine/threonine-protein kinase Nek7-like [Daktulosphaira vitifoliae]|uniref:serine/threonine-protein kinase Nek7-like n=1 Tax=Daktulosphaira vitifoliae TaxID=58002 RepID=UPI0021AA37DE|nr:serine/threonine-protein kinase Nek7-like [Daktulosphaira vitifoliae]